MATIFSIVSSSNATNPSTVDRFQPSPIDHSPMSSLVEPQIEPRPSLCQKKLAAPASEKLY